MGRWVGRGVASGCRGLRARQRGCRGRRRRAVRLRAWGRRGWIHRPRRPWRRGTGRGWPRGGGGRRAGGKGSSARPGWRRFGWGRGGGGAPWWWWWWPWVGGWVKVGGRLDFGVLCCVVWDVPLLPACSVVCSSFAALGDGFGSSHVLYGMVVWCGLGVSVACSRTYLGWRLVCVVPVQKGGGGGG